MLETVYVAPPARQIINPPTASAIQQRPPQIQQPVPQAAPRRAVLLLPLSGPHAQLGQQLLQAAQLAVQDLAPSHFTVQPYDTARGAAAQAQQALQTPADIIIGPLFSADVAAVKPVATAMNVPVLALSNDITNADNNTFLMGAWPGDQIQRVLGYAAQQGVRSVVAVLPDNAYGKVVQAALPASVPVITYTPQAPNIPAIMYELKNRAGQYDAVLLPDGGTRTAQIAAAMQQGGYLTNARLLGSTQWDQIGDTSPFTGGWYATTDKEAEAAFVRRYLAAFGEPPPALASFAYDATALAALIAARNWTYEINSLTQGQGFGGMAGVFRLQPGGMVQRALAIEEITPSGSRIVEAAPSRF